MEIQNKFLNALGSGLRLIIGAIAVGIIAGCAGVLYLALVSIIFNFCFVGTVSFTYVRGILAQESRWGVGIILVPILGGVIVSWLLKTFGANERGVSAPDLIPFINKDVASKSYTVELTKALASTITIGTGGSVGQEIPIVQLGATLSYLFSRVTNFSGKERMILLAAGSAAGLSAAFNAPLTGITFAVEILLFGFSLFAVCLIAISAYIGAFIGQLFVGSKIVFQLTLLPIDSWSIYFQNLLMFVPFGIWIGLVAVLFNTGLNRTEYLFSKTVKNIYLRHAIGMTLVGIMLYAMFYYSRHYYIDRLGHATIQQVLDAVITDGMLLLIILIAKLLSIWITLGTGASGGIFTPSLFLGAIMGALCSLLFQHYFPHTGISHVYFIVCGMGGMLAGMTGAMLTAIVFIFEITDNPQIIIYLLVTVALATYIRLIYYPRGIYTYKLFNNGLMFDGKLW